MKNLIITSLILAGLLVSIAIAQEPAEATRLVVKGIVAESPAQKAGIMSDDILLKYDGKPTPTLKELFALKDQAKGDSVEVIILRGQQEMKFKLPTGQMGLFLNELLPDIKFKEDAVVIEGVPKLGWDTGKMNSFLAALEAIANHLGVPKDYVELNGISGAAFRFQFFKDWCPSSPDPTCGYNVGEDALRALGFEFKCMELAKDGNNKEAMKDAIMQSISKKMPVIAIDLIETPEWGIITGYQNNGEELLCCTYFDKRDGYEIAEKFPFAIYIITERKEPPNDNENYKKSFGITLKNLKTKMYGDYYSGIAAFNKWVERLEKDNFAAKDSAAYYNCALANAWMYDRLTEDRGNAAEYLERIVEEFPELTVKLQGLAEFYQEEAGILKEPKDLVIYSYNMKSRDDWSPEMRKKEIPVLRQVKAKEEAALKYWEEIAKLTANPKK
jgi:hypothetical protein